MGWRHSPASSGRSERRKLTMQQREAHERAISCDLNKQRRTDPVT
jgi:hypothetical protein